jgi:hypothetical protein
MVFLGARCGTSLCFDRSLQAPSSRRRRRRRCYRFGLDGRLSAYRRPRSDARFRKAFRTQKPQVFPRHLLLGVLERAERGAKDERKHGLRRLPLRPFQGKEMEFQDHLRRGHDNGADAGERTGKGCPSDRSRLRVHPLVPHVHSCLRGVRISLLGVLGHSDADGDRHSVADALLGAGRRTDLRNAAFPPRKTLRNAIVVAFGRSVQAQFFRAWIVEWVDVT